MALVFLGDPMVDIMIECSTEFLHSQGIAAESIGGSELVSHDALDALRTAACQSAGVANGGYRRTGGSASNVARCVSRLERVMDSASATQDASRRSVRFIGMVGDDADANDFEAALREHGVEPLLIRSSSGAATGTCLCLVTEGGQRTMRTCLGAADELQNVAQLPRGWDEHMAWLHCEGYSLHRPDVALKIIGVAHEAGAKVSIDMASFEVVQYCWPTLERLLTERKLHTVFANEEEAAAVVAQSAAKHPNGTLAATAVDLSTKSSNTGLGGDSLDCQWVTSAEQQQLLDDGIPAAAQSWLLRYCSYAVVSLGGRGCVARSSNGHAAACIADTQPVVDTVGAGDSFAAGWLTAHLAGADLADCCAAGCAAGTAAVCTVGGVPDEDTITQLAGHIMIVLGRRQINRCT